MGTIWVKELTGGLDVRRLLETTPGGVLIKGSDGHITRGGEFEKRAAFVSAYTLPSGTVGLAQDSAGLVVFGSAVAPTMPTGVRYQRLQHPSGLALIRVLSSDLYAGKIYAVAQFSDGSIFHFYDGTRVEDWFDGRARAVFVVSDGSSASAVAATGTVTVTAGTITGGIAELRVGGVNIISAAVPHTGSNDTTAAALAAAINTATTTPDYTAVATGSLVTITAAVPGAAPNGRAITYTVTGDAELSIPGAMSGGADATVSAVQDMRVDGVSLLAAPVAWAGTAEATASALAAAISAYSSTPDYTATAVGAKVYVVAVDAGSASNGREILFTLTNGLVVSSDVVFAGGEDPADAFTPGTFVKTVRTKMYSVSGSLLHFSGIQEPTQWTTDATGAGFINLATEDAAADQLTSVARYQGQLAVFAPSVVMIWYIDPDPTNNTLSQVLSNTGTSFARAVTQFGDSDVFYLDSSGLRSLRARDSSNAAATTDIGIPVDALITAKVEALSETDRQRVFGLINPLDKRFWLIIKDEIFVFSFYQNAKVSAWTTYNTARTVDGVTTTFSVDDVVVYADRVFLRSGDAIYAYGSVTGDLQYDETSAEAWLPYLDANRPTVRKQWTGLDVAVRGLWQVSVAMQPTDLEASVVVANVYETTFNENRLPLSHQSSHMSLRVASRGPDPAILSSAVIHYLGKEPDE